MAVRRRYIRTLVEQLLDEHNITSVPVDVEALAARLGARLYKEVADDDLSGFLYRDQESGVPIIGVNARHGENRKRFTIGHEIGHLLLHEGESVHVDRSGYVYRFRRERDASEMQTDEDEIEANVFAAELLMPVRFLEADMANYTAKDFLGEDGAEDILVPLAERYGVSTQALTFRLANLNYIQI